MRQQVLAIVEEEEDRLLAEEFLALVSSVVTSLGAKKVAARLRVSAAALSHGLSRYENRAFRAEWVAIIDAIDPERRLSRWLAEQAGYDVKQVDRRTDAEKLRALLDQVELAGDVGERMKRAAGLAP